MIQDDEYIRTLMGLGLTFLQAKTYLALIKLGKAEVKTISRASSVARQDVYRVMPALQKLGLAEKIIATPTMYQAIPLRISLLTLIQQKIEENAELQKKAKALIYDFEENNSGIELKEDEPQFIITSERSIFRKRIAESTDAAQTSTDAIYSLEGFRAILFNHRKYLKRALRRGVKIRVIIEKPENQQLTKRIAHDLMKDPSFKLKYTSAHAPVCMVIFDSKEVNVRISDGAVPSLWSNNPNIVNLAVSYFDELWNKAYENLNPNQKFTRKSSKLKQPQTANSHHTTELTTSLRCTGSVSKFT